MVLKDKFEIGGEVGVPAGPVGALLLPQPEAGCRDLSYLVEGCFIGLRCGAVISPTMTPNTVYEGGGKDVLTNNSMTRVRCLQVLHLSRTLALLATLIDSMVYGAQRDGRDPNGSRPKKRRFGLRAECPLTPGYCSDQLARTRLVEDMLRLPHPATEESSTTLSALASGAVTFLLHANRQTPWRKVRATVAKHIQACPSWVGYDHSTGQFLADCN